MTKFMYDQSYEMIPIGEQFLHEGDRIIRSNGNGMSIPVMDFSGTNSRSGYYISTSCCIEYSHQPTPFWVLEASEIVIERNPPWVSYVQQPLAPSPMRIDANSLQPTVRFEEPPMRRLRHDDQVMTHQEAQVRFGGIEMCPFCAFELPGVLMSRRYRVECPCCGAEGPTAHDPPTAIIKWNERRGE